MSEHIIQPKTYYAIFAALIAVTCLTIGVSMLDLGKWHTAVGLIFAVCKAMLVVLFFMHLIYSDRMTWIVAGAGVFWLAILIGLTLTDYLSRGYQPY